MRRQLFVRTRFLHYALLLCLISSLFAAQSVSAAEFTAGTAQELIDAINAANANDNADPIPDTSPDTITLTADITFTNFHNQTDGNNALPVISTDLTIKSSDGNTFTLSRSTEQGTPGFRFFFVSNAGVNTQLTLQNVVLQNGSADAANYPGNSGGAILTYDDVTLQNVTLQNNFASSFGGAIATNGGSITISNSSVDNNSSGGSGGALEIFNTGGDNTITNSTLTNNSASFDGGAIRALQDTRLTISGSQLNVNSANAAGAVYFSGMDLTITNSEIGYNTANFGNGGGVFVFGARPTLDDVEIRYNTANGDGGGVFVDGGGLTVTNSLLEENEGRGGGGIYIQGAQETEESLSLNNSTLRNNVAYGTSATQGDVGGFTQLQGGGGVSALGIINATGSTFDGNTSFGMGGAIFARSGLNATESVFVNNTAPNTDGYNGAAIAADNQASVSNSCIVNNGPVAVAYYHDATINLPDVWWGAGDGPASAGGSGDTVVVFNEFGSADTSNFKTSAPAFCAGETKNTPYLASTSAELVQAIESANADPGHDLIQIDSQLIFDQAYTDAVASIETDAPSATGQPNALPLITSAITLQGNVGSGIERDSTQGTAQFRLLELERVGSMVGMAELVQLALRNGDSVGDGGAVYNGGGILQLRDSTLTGNRADGDGGAIMNAEDGLTVTERGLFRGNTAAGGQVFPGRGGAIQNFSDIFGGFGNATRGENMLDIINTLFVENTAATSGGAVNGNFSPMSVRGGGFFRNSAGTDGGALYNDSGLGETIIGQRIDPGIGSLEANPANRTYFIENSAAGNGGAIAFISGGPQRQINGTRFVGNSASSGGALALDFDATVALDEVEFSHNSATAEGGALFNRQGEFNAMRTEFYSNNAPNGGATVTADASASQNPAAGTSISASCILQNDDTALIARNSGTQTVENNWWGTDDGPSGTGPGTGDSIDANHDADPFSFNRLTDECDWLRDFDNFLELSSTDPVNQGWGFINDGIYQSVTFNQFEEGFGVADQAQGGTIYFDSPPWFEGDLTPLSGFTLSYTLRLGFNVESENYFDTYDVLIAGTNGTLLGANLGIQPPIDESATFGVALLPESFELVTWDGYTHETFQSQGAPTQQQFNAVLADVEGVFLRGEYIVGPETALLQQVQVQQRLPLEASTQQELIDAFQLANEDSIPDVINITADITLDTPQAGSSFAFVDTPIRIEGNGFTISRDESAELFRFVDATSDGAHLEIDNLTLDNFGVNGESGGTLNLAASGQTTTLTNVSIRNSEANDGGAINALNTTLQIFGGTFSSNSARFGGAINANSTTLTLDGTTFHQNRATSGTPPEPDAGFGGAINAFQGSLSISNSSFTNNLSSRDGGALNFGAANGTISNTLFDNNQSFTFGGAVFVGSGPDPDPIGSLDVTNTTLQRNTASANGGIIHITARSNMTITDSVIGGVDPDTQTLRGNQALPIFNGGTLTITNTEISYNQNSFIEEISSANEEETDENADADENTDADDTEPDEPQVDDFVNAGVLSMDQGATTIIDSSRIENNYADFSGVFNAFDGTLTIRNGSVLSGNFAFNSGSAGVLAVGGASTLTLSISDTCIVNNGFPALFNDPGNAALALPGIWWGDPSGPGGIGPGVGDTLEGNIDFAGFLTAAPAYCADLLKDSPYVANSVSQLVAAVDAANRDADTDEIFLSENITFTQPHNLDAGANALPLVTSPIIINGNQLMLSRDATSSPFRFFYVSEAGSSNDAHLTLNNLTLQDGQVGGDGGPLAYQAGAIYNDRGMVTLNGVTLRNNAASEGGAIYNNRGSLNIANSTLNNNRADQASASGTLRGGAIYNIGTALSVADTRFEGNRAATDGGAVYNATTSNVISSFTDSIFNNNQADGTGGAVRVAGGGFQLLTANNETCFVGNSDTAIVNNTDTPISAQNIWWGTGDGPDGAGPGTGDSVGANVDFSNFLQARPDACLLAIPAVSTAQELADAITAANNTPQIQSFIDLAADIVVTEALNAGAAADGQSNATGLTAFPTITSEVIIRGFGNTIRRDASAAAMRFFEVADGATFILDDMTISGGLLSGTDEHGAAIYAAGTLLMQDLVFSNNQAQNGSGGALYTAAGSNLEMVESTFSQNSANRCGAIAADAVADIQFTRFTENSAADGGGALCALATGDALVQASLIENNTSNGPGGAVFVNDGRVRFRTSIAIANTAIGAVGGAFANINRGTVDIDDSNLLANSSDGDDGGALHNDGLSTFTLNDSCIVNNSSTAIVNLNPTSQNATSNWWGAADGPSGAGTGNGDSVSSNVDFSNFNTSDVFACGQTGQLPDLRLTAFDVTPDHVAHGSTQASYTLANDGTQGASNIVIGFYLSGDAICDPNTDTFLGTADVAQLAQGATFSNTTPVTLALPRNDLNERAKTDDSANQVNPPLSTSSESICAVVDPSDAIAEGNETNNNTSTQGADRDDVTYFPWDAGRDGIVTTSELIEAVNQLGAVASQAPASWYDFDGNGVVGPSDVIAAILRLNYQRNDAVCENGDCTSAP